MTWDSILSNGYSVMGGANVQMTAAGPAVIETGNSSPRLVAPSGNTRGIPLTDSFGDVGAGRLTLGMIQIGIVLLVLAYIWTRNVQGGG